MLRDKSAVVHIGNLSNRYSTVQHPGVVIQTFPLLDATEKNDLYLASVDAATTWGACIADCK